SYSPRTANISSSAQATTIRCRSSTWRRGRSWATCLRDPTRSSSTFILQGVVYIANEDDALMTAIDPAERKVVAEVPVGVEPEGVGISPAGKTLIATSETS